MRTYPIHLSQLIVHQNVFDLLESKPRISRVSVCCWVQLLKCAHVCCGWSEKLGYILRNGFTQRISKTSIWKQFAKKHSSPCPNCEESERIHYLRIYCCSTRVSLNCPGSSQRIFGILTNSRILSCSFLHECVEAKAFLRNPVLFAPCLANAFSSTRLIVSPGSAASSCRSS